MRRRPMVAGPILSVLIGTVLMLSFAASSPALAQAACGGLGAVGFNGGGGFQGGFQGGFNNFGGNFQGGFQGFQFAQFGQFGGQGIQFGGGGFQGGFQGGQFQGGQFGGQFQGGQFGGQGIQLGGFQGGFQGGFNFGGGGFQGGFQNFGQGGLNFNTGIAPFAANFGGRAGCPGGVFGLIPDAATVAPGDTLMYRLVSVTSTNWQDLQYLDLRIRDAAGNVLVILRWVQGTDEYQLIDPATGAVLARGAAGGNGILDSRYVTLILSNSYSENTGPAGEAVGLNVTARFKELAPDRVYAIDVGSKLDAAAPTPYELGSLLFVVSPPVNSPGDDDDDDARAHHKPTEEQIQQRERSNRSNLDDYRTEGNAVEASCDGDMPTVTIANRDGHVVLRLLREAKQSCSLVKPGDYVEAIGEKQHELLYDVDQMTVHRSGTRVR